MKTFTPREDPKPNLSIKEIEINEYMTVVKIGKKYIQFESEDVNDLKYLCLAMYNYGFDDGVKAHKKVVSKLT